MPTTLSRCAVAAAHCFFLWSFSVVWTVSSLATVSRRSCLQDTVATTCRGIFLVLPLTFPSPRKAWALKERNEALCQTGFFTNIMQYRCTDIGDISDEGEARRLSESQEKATDALLSKLGMEAPSSKGKGLKSGSDESGKANWGHTTEWNASE